VGLGFAGAVDRYFRAAQVDAQEFWESRVIRCVVRVLTREPEGKGWWKSVAGRPI
jgi:hypothetical protein